MPVILHVGGHVGVLGESLRVEVMGEVGKGEDITEAGAVVVDAVI